MTSARNTLLSCLTIAVPAVALLAAAPDASAQWTCWGGPNGDFKTECKGLAKKWPDDGPKTLWRRPLGEGYSTILVDGDRIYTMYSESIDETPALKEAAQAASDEASAEKPSAEKPSDEAKRHIEHVVALDAKTGRTLWDTKYDAPFEKGMGMEFGEGPHATPLIVGDRIFTVGCTGIFHCLSKQDGKIAWTHNICEEFGAMHLGRGYAASPIAYKDTVLLTCAGSGQGVVAFNQADGQVAWKALDFKNGAATPLMIRYGDRDMMIVVSLEDVMGVDPANGKLLWKFEHKGTNLSSPIWVPERKMVFIATAYKLGARAIRIEQTGSDEYKAMEAWFTPKVDVHFSNYIEIDGTIYAGIGDFGPSFFTAVDMSDGSILWRARQLPKATMVYGDGRLIALGEDGMLALIEPSPKQLNVVSSVQIAAKNAWTVPTLVGTTLYLRDRKEIMALDVGAGA
jgi:outer membrane protein assembly factor BamB